jgi:hypothetical protein
MLCLAGLWALHGLRLGGHGTWLPGWSGTSVTCWAWAALWPKLAAIDLQGIEWNRF